MKPLSIKAIANAIHGEYCGKDALITAVSTDSRDVPSGSLFVALEGDAFDGHDYITKALEQAAFAVAMHLGSPGEWPADRVLQVADTRRALMEIAGLYRRSLPVKVVGITGSVGKTTTKEMVACVLEAAMPTAKTQANLNNEIGLSHTILGLEENHQAAVLEMGMDGPGQMHYLSLCAAPDVGIITNIGVSHMEKLGSREGIRDEKLALRDGMADGGTLILNGDDNMLNHVRDSRLKLLYYAIDNKDADAVATEIVEISTGSTFRILYNGNCFAAHLPVLGKHNLYNALAAFLAGVTLGMNPADAAAALKHYQPTGMRQKVVEHSGFTVVEDCYNASPDSMQAALKTLGAMDCKGKRIAVLSDMKELGELEHAAHRDIGKAAAAFGADLLLCTGPLSLETVTGAREAGLLAASHYPDMDALYEALAGQVSPGDVVWFKASRSMRLEQVIKRLYELL